MILPVLSAQLERRTAFCGHQPQSQSADARRRNLGFVQHFRPRPHRVTAKSRVGMRTGIQTRDHLRVGQAIERQAPRH